MGVDLVNLELILGLVKQHRPKRILAFGHPDILVPDDYLEEHFGLTGCRGFSHVIFTQLGAELRVIDRRHVPGVDEVADLNFPLDQRHHRQYDMVIDSGTTEHVFNVGNVFVSVAQALRVGGIVYHCNPLAMFNHGYWNISPVAYHDFYTQNGFEILRLDMQRKGEFIPLERVNGFRLDDYSRIMMVCVARKLADCQGYFPMQAKYR